MFVCSSYLLSLYFVGTIDLVFIKLPFDDMMSKYTLDFENTHQRLAIFASIFANR